MLKKFFCPPPPDHGGAPRVEAQAPRPHHPHLLHAPHLPHPPHRPGAERGCRQSDGKNAAHR